MILNIVKLIYKGNVLLNHPPFTHTYIFYSADALTSCFVKQTENMVQ